MLTISNVLECLALRHLEFIQRYPKMRAMWWSQRRQKDAGICRKLARYADMLETSVKRIPNFRDCAARKNGSSWWCNITNIAWSDARWRRLACLPLSGALHCPHCMGKDGHVDIVFTQVPQDAKRKKGHGAPTTWTQPRSAHFKLQNEMSQCMSLMTGCETTRFLEQSKHDLPRSNVRHSFP